MMGEWRSHRSPTTAISSTRSAGTAPSTTPRPRCQGSSPSGGTPATPSRPPRKGARISVSRGIDDALIENLDFEVSEEDSLATTDVIEAHILGRQLHLPTMLFMPDAGNGFAPAPPLKNGNGVGER